MNVEGVNDMNVEVLKRRRRRSFYMNVEGVYDMNVEGVHDMNVEVWMI